MTSYHCCATCIHFQVQKHQSGTKFFCKRLGYETKSTYQFHCWQPKDAVKRLMNKKDNEGSVV